MGMKLLCLLIYLPFRVFGAIVGSIIVIVIGEPILWIMGREVKA